MYDVMVKYIPNFGDIRILVDNGEVMFCGCDVAKMLGYRHPNNAIHQHCKHSKKYPIVTKGRTKSSTFDLVVEVVFIPERDLHHLFMHSRLKNGNIIEDWIETHILPNISIPDT